MYMRLVDVMLILIRPGVGEVKDRLLSLGAEHVLTEEELGKLDKKTFLVYFCSPLVICTLDRG